MQKSEFQNHLELEKKSELRKTQNEANLPVHAMPTDNNTHWNSKFKLMCFILDQEAALRLVLNDRNTLDLIPSADTFQVITKSIM